MTLANYNDDFFLWTQQQSTLLRERQLHALDAINLAEEIESVGKRDRRAITSHLVNLLLHLLKWHYAPERRSVSWRLSILNARREIGLVADDSPSLRSQFAELIQVAYPKARQGAADETGLPLEIFPELCPFTLEQIITTSEL